MNCFCKFLQGNDVNFRKRYFFQNIVMSVVSNKIFCVGTDGTVDKFVVVRVGGNHIEIKVWVDKFHVGTLNNGIDDCLGKSRSKQTLKNFIIFVKYLVRYAHSVFPRQKSVPYNSVVASESNALDNAVCVDDNTHGNYFSFLSCVSCS